MVLEIKAPVLQNKAAAKVINLLSDLSYQKEDSPFR